MSLRDSIKKEVAAKKPDLLRVPTPELPTHDGKIFVSLVSPLAMKEAFKKEEGEEDEGIDYRARLVVLATVDSEGSRIFQDDDVLFLSTTPQMTPVVERLYAAAMYHNGMTSEKYDSWRKNLRPTAENGLHSSSAERSTPASV